MGFFELGFLFCFFESAARGLRLELANKGGWGWTFCSLRKILIFENYVDDTGS